MLHRRLADALTTGLMTQMRARKYFELSVWDDLTEPGTYVLDRARTLSG